jgi:DMSO/TMAO reductase YedYZ heme-binding membrane subunit
MKKNLHYLVFAGNIIAFLWLLMNGIDESFKGLGLVQLVATISVMILFLVNASLIYTSRKDLK